jgi:acylphosphatase
MIVVCAFFHHDFCVRQIRKCDLKFLMRSQFSRFARNQYAKNKNQLIKESIQGNNTIMDPLKKIEALEAKRDALEKALAQPGISEAERIAIRNQVSAIDGQITAWIARIPAQTSSAMTAQPATSTWTMPTSAVSSLPAGSIPIRPIHYQRAEMEGVGRKGQKQIVWSIASKHGVSGYVQRLSMTKLGILVVSTDPDHIARFYFELDEKRNSSCSLTLKPPGESTTSDERMRKVLGAGFKKISNRSLGSEVSLELTPEDGASDIVSHAESLASTVWPWAQT